MTSRTGSSMVAGIFNQHGLWCGDDYFTGSGYGKDYLSYEMVPVKRWMQDRYNLQGDSLVSHDRAPEFRELIEGMIPTGKQWMWKGGVMFWPLFRQFDPYIIFIKRDFDSSVNAIMARPKAAPRETVKRLISNRYKLMDEIQAVQGGVVVRTDHLISGDLSTLEEAFDYCGIELNQETVKKVIDPGMWHFNA